MPDIRHLFQLGDWLKYEPETDRNNIQLWIIKYNLTINKTFRKCAALYKILRSCFYLQTLLGAVAPVAVLTAEWLLSVGLVAPGQNVTLEIALCRGDVDALRAVPALA